MRMHCEIEYKKITYTPHTATLGSNKPTQQYYHCYQCKHYWRKVKNQIKCHSTTALRHTETFSYTSRTTVIYYFEISCPGLVNNQASPIQHYVVLWCCSLKLLLCFESLPMTEIVHYMVHQPFCSALCYLFHLFHIVHYQHP